MNWEALQNEVSQVRKSISALSRQLNNKRAHWRGLTRSRREIKSKYLNIKDALEEAIEIKQELHREYESVLNLSMRKKFIILSHKITGEDPPDLNEYNEADVTEESRNYEDKLSVLEKEIDDLREKLGEARKALHNSTTQMKSTQNFIKETKSEIRELNRYLSLNVLTDVKVLERSNLGIGEFIQLRERKLDYKKRVISFIRFRSYARIKGEWYRVDELPDKESKKKPNLTNWLNELLLQREE